MPEQEQRLQDLYSRKQQIEGFLNTHLWREYDGNLIAIVRSKRSGAFGTLIGLDACFARATVEGEIAGLQLARAIPQIMLDDVNKEIEDILAEIRKEE